MRLIQQIFQTNEGDIALIKFERFINVIDAHTAGEPVRVVTSGLQRINGRTMLEKMRWLQDRMDGIRNFLMREPRGHRDMFGTILTPPTTEDGDVGILYTHTTGQSTMCGHGTIGAITVLLETGMIASHEGENVVRIDTPAGRVTAGAKVENGRVVEVSFQNVPSFLYQDDIAVEIPGIGRTKVAVSYGGAFYVFVEAEALGLRVIPENASRIAEHSMWLKDWGNRELNVKHPLNDEIRGIYGVIVTDSSTRRKNGIKSKETCVFADGAVDRSPCGTGTSARLALLHAHGEISVGEVLENDSILDTTFKGVIKEEVMVGDKKGIVPIISGSAWITGFNQLVLDPEDPLPEGFLI